MMMMMMMTMTTTTTTTTTMMISLVLSEFFKGESSSGKSTVMNLILDMERKIVPKSITPSTSRVCRVRYSDSRSISTLDKQEKEIDKLVFTDEDGMVESLKTLATNHSADIFYVDIRMPVSILKVFHLYLYKREVIEKVLS